VSKPHAITFLDACLKKYITLDHLSARRQDLNAIREEVCWTGVLSDGTWEPIDGDDNGSSADWLDDPESDFRTFTASILKSAGFGHLGQSWGERLAREEHSWAQVLTQVYEAYIVFNSTGPPPTPESPPESSAVHDSHPQTFSLLCITLTSES
jgi:hypothetical protein